MPGPSSPIVTELLAGCIEQGRDVLARASLIGDFSDYESWKGTRKQWIERTAEGLARIYGGPVQADEFTSAASAPASEHPSALTGEQQWQIEYKRDSNCVRSAIDVLVSLQDRPQENHAVDSELPERRAIDAEDEQGPADRYEPSQSPVVDSELEHEPVDHAEPARSPVALSELEHEPVANGSLSSLPATRSSVGPTPDRTRQVFLVHGRNEELKQAVAGLLERTGPHEVTILNERPSDRRMLVEQIVEHTAESRYAVVLLTADDVGAPRIDSDREPYFSPRARQGVVFEMGVLVAALPPRCMCVLYEDGVELPCDLDGIAYVRLDLTGTWQSKLLLHLRGAGFDYDLNRLAPI